MFHMNLEKIVRMSPTNKNRKITFCVYFNIGFGLFYLWHINLCGYLMPKTSFKKNSNGTI